MPTYDYVCENGHRFELFQSMKDDALDRCTQCDAPARRVIGPGAGFIFKGGGFYITDYRSKEYKDKAKSESGSGAAPADKPGDAKPASGSAAAAGSSGGEAAKPAKPAGSGGSGGATGGGGKGGSGDGGSKPGG